MRISLGICCGVVAMKFGEKSETRLAFLKFAVGFVLVCWCVSVLCKVEVSGMRM